jgi:hypothetical protein
MKVKKVISSLGDKQFLLNKISWNLQQKSIDSILPNQAIS